MEEPRKRQLLPEEGSCGGETAAKTPRSAESEEKVLNEDDIWAVFVTSTDETVSDLFSELLETSETASGAFRVRFVDDPYAATVVFLRSTSYVTINGNDESCGSSFSDSDASAMANIDARGVHATEGSGAWDSREAEAGAGDWEGDLASWLGQDCGFD